MAETDKDDSKTASPSQTPSADKKATDSKPPRKRRWIWRTLLGVLVFLVLLIALAPTLVSTGAGRSLVLSIVNSKLKGTVAMADLSVSWFSPCRVEGLSVTDLQGRKVLQVAKVDIDRGLFGLATNSKQLGNVNVGTPQADLYPLPEGGYSLAQALEEKQPSPPKEKKEKSTGPTVTLKLSGGQVRLYQPDGRRYAISDASAQVQVQTLNDITAEFAATFPGTDKPGKLTAKASFKDLMPDGNMDLAKMSGKVVVKTEPEIDMTPVLEFAASSPEASGKLTINVDSEFGPNKGGGTFSIHVAQLKAASKEMREVSPIDVDLGGKMELASSHLKGNVDLKAGTIGEINTTVDYNVADKAKAATDDIVDQLMQGQSIALSEFTLDSKGAIDVAALAKSIPALLKLRDGAQIQSGQFKVADVHVQGGAKPSASGAITLDLTTVRKGQQPKVWQPIKINFDVQTDDKNKLQIKDTGLTSAFATLTAKGTPADLRVGFDTDLDLLRQYLNELVDLDDTIMSGKASGTLLTDRNASDEKRIDLKLTADATQVVYASKSQPKPATAPAAPATAAAAPTFYTGQVQWTAGLIRLPDGLKLTGTLDVPKLLISSVGEVFTSDQPHVTHDLTLYSNKAGAYDRLDLAGLQVKSRILALDLSGQVTDLGSQKLLNLKGDYTASWPEMTALAKRLSPEGARTVVMLGNWQGPIEVTGPANNPSVKPLPTYGQVKGGTTIGWSDKSSVYGITMGSAKLQPALADAILKIPQEKIAANGGWLRLGATVDLRGAEPVLDIPGKVQVMENIGLNEDVGREILSRALPLFAQTSKLEGKVNLTLEDIHVPLGPSLLKSGRGKGRLDLSDVRLVPSGDFGKLTKMLGLQGDAAAHPMKVSGADFELKDGALHFDNMILTLGVGTISMDLKFRGKVHFDDSVEMTMSVPVRLPMLQTLGVKTPPDPSGLLAKTLEGMWVDIPIMGTRKNPQLDFSKLNPAKLLEDAMKKVKFPTPTGLPPLPSGLPRL